MRRQSWLKLSKEMDGAAISAEAVPALIRLLDRPEDDEKRAAAFALAKFGRSAKDAAPALRKNLFPSNRDVAWFSAEALGNIGEPAAEALPDLMRTLRENIGACDGYFATFCGSFIPAIGKMRGAAVSVVPELEGFLNHKDPYVRMRIAAALLRIDAANTSALQEIEKLLASSDVEIRSRMLFVLSQSGKDARPAKHLIETATKDSDDEVREKAIKLLKNLNN